MRKLILTIFIITHAVCNGQAAKSSEESDIDQRKQMFLASSYKFFLPLYKAMSQFSDVNFVCSPRSVWIMLAAIAEGSNEETQQQLLKILQLPIDTYERQKYYQLMISSDVLPIGVDLVETRTLLIDENLNINPAWLNLVSKNSLIDVRTVPIRYDPILTTSVVKAFVNEPKLNLTGNSLLLDTIDYYGFWSTAFDDAVIENSPFYNKEGEVIGVMDFMRMKHRAKVGYAKGMNAKILELPIGVHSSHRMIFAIPFDQGDISDVIKNLDIDIVRETLTSVNESNVPIDIAIPRFEITSEIDMREILKDLGVTSLWTNPGATTNISTPPAFPTSYVQRATLSLNKYGVAPSIQQIPAPGALTGLDPILGTDFIANRPFIFGLFDIDYKSFLWAGFSGPTVNRFGKTYLRKIL